MVGKLGSSPLYAIMGDIGPDYSKTPQTRTYFSKKQTEWILTNEVLMTFSGCGSYRKETWDYDEYIAI